MELDGVPEHQAGFGAGGDVLVGREQQVQRRELLFLAPCDQRLHQQGAAVGVACEQACARHRREGHRDDRLRVVGQPVLFIGIGPCPVEHVLAVGMRLDVERAGGRQLPAAPQRDEARRPAAAGRSAAALMHGAQVGVAHEGGGCGLRGQQVVPGGGVDLGRRPVNADERVGQGSLVSACVHRAFRRCRCRRAPAPAPRRDRPTGARPGSRPPAAGRRSAPG